MISRLSSDEEKVDVPLPVVRPHVDCQVVDTAGHVVCSEVLPYLTAPSLGIVLDLDGIVPKESFRPNRHLFC